MTRLDHHGQRRAFAPTCTGALCRLRFFSVAPVLGTTTASDRIHGLVRHEIATDFGTWKPPSSTDKRVAAHPALRAQHNFAEWLIPPSLRPSWQAQFYRAHCLPNPVPAAFTL